MEGEVDLRVVDGPEPAAEASVERTPMSRREARAAERAPLEAARTWTSGVQRSYERGSDDAGDERPLRGYAVLLGVYATALASLVAVVRRRGLPTAAPGAVDLALLSVATFRVSRTLGKDAVLAPLRAPFVTFAGAAGAGEVTEAPRSGPVRHAVGELLTCPFCLTQWVATAGMAGLALAPRATRWVTTGLTAVAAADALHLAYARLQESAE